jgi:MFS family permease
MEPEPIGRSRFNFTGSSGLIVAGAVVVVLLVMLPAYRWFFLISVILGLVIAGALTMWYRFHPVKEQEVPPKRPLGL